VGTPDSGLGPGAECKALAMSTSLAYAPHGLALKSGPRAYSPLLERVSQRLTIQSRTWIAGILPVPAVRRSVSG